VKKAIANILKYYSEVDELKKYISQKDMKKAGKTALALVLAGTFTFSSTLAYASETGTENNNLDKVELTSLSSTDVEDNNLVVTNNDVSAETKSDTEVEMPTLVPGDFFYFAKLTIEKIKLILTMNDVKEAELLAKFASERLAEAEALFAQGEEKVAIETIEKALEDMQMADTVVVEQQEKEETEETTVIEENVVNEDQTKVDEDVKEEATETELPKTEAPTSEATTTENQTTEDQTNDEEALEEIETLLSQNIIALTAAMEKVQNPVAKAALKKNIEKSYAKLEKKLAKIEARLAKEAIEDEKEIEDVATETTTVEADTDIEIVEEDTNTTIVVPVKKEVKAEEKKARKAVKEEAKKIKHEAKKEAKELKKETKKDRKDRDQKDRHDRKNRDNDGHKRNGNDNH
jgi:hypothetical protein